MELNDPAPDFSLKGTDGNAYSLKDFAQAKALVVVFSCNHCPYVKATEDRMTALAKEYTARGVQWVAINSNDAQNYPDDSFEEMVKRAKEKGFPFPYVRDDSQQVARAYGATHTPHIFCFDAARKLRYTGLIDDNWKDPAQVKKRHLRDAIEALLAGKAPSPAETHAIGCTIKWKQ